MLAVEPWWILEGDELRDTVAGLRSRYPELDVVPFASRQDNDDIACFDSAHRVLIFHDFASPGWERRQRFPDFHAWLRQAIEDFIFFGEQEESTCGPKQ